MSNSPSKIRYRKRNRQFQFDLNRSSPYIRHKITKPNTPKAGIRPDNNEEMAEGNSSPDRIKDLSQTIITGSSQAQQANNMVTSDRMAQSSSRQSIITGKHDNLLEIRKLIDIGVSSQIADIRKTMADLATTVGRLSLVVQQTQQENRQLLETKIQKESSVHKHKDQPMDVSGLPELSAQSSRASSRCSSDTRDYSRLRIDKWGLEFDGNNNKLAVEDFVFRLERLQRQYGVSWREVLDNFHLLVKGAAEKWYWLFIQTNYVSEWSTLKSALLKQYKATRSSFELMRDMVERKQMPGESIDDFFFAMSQFRSRLDISMPEEEMIKLMKKNLRESVGRIVYPMNVATVEELRTTCLDAEKTFLKKDAKPQPMLTNRYVRHVSELHKEPAVEEDCVEVAAVNLNSGNKAIFKTPLICWNCRQDGHAFMDCPSEQRSIFCFRCGKPDVKAPNCDACRKRNFSRSEGRAGDLRASMNPQE